MKKESLHPPSSNKEQFFSLVNHSLKLKLYLLANLPAAFFSGVRVVRSTHGFCTTSVPYKAFTKNPFRSTYFACLGMAAELSTGVLAMANLYKRKPAVSMLITGMEGKFYKKANAKTFFTCNDGDAIREAINTAIKTKVGQAVTARSIGTNEANELVAEFWFTWSFKAK